MSLLFLSQSFSLLLSYRAYVHLIEDVSILLYTNIMQSTYLFLMLCSEHIAFGSDSAALTEVSSIILGY